MSSNTPPPWPGSPVPDTAQWTARCLARLLSLDSSLAPEEADAIANDMGSRSHWRRLQPEAAAEVLFLPVPAIVGAKTEPPKL